VASNFLKISISICWMTPKSSDIFPFCSLTATVISWFRCFLYFCTCMKYLSVFCYVFFNKIAKWSSTLMQLELFLSSGTFCLAFYSLVTAIFGMNIPYTWNDDHDYLFKWVCKWLLFTHVHIYIYIGFANLQQFVFLERIYYNKL